MCPVFSRNRPLAYATMVALFALVALNSMVHGSPAPNMGESLPVLGLWDPLNSPDPMPNREPLPFADIQALVRQWVEQTVNRFIVDQGANPKGKTVPSYLRNIQVESTPMRFKKRNNLIGTALEIIHVLWCGITRRYLVSIQRRISWTERVGGETLTLQLREYSVQGHQANGVGGQAENDEPLAKSLITINQDEAIGFITRKLLKGEAPDLKPVLLGIYRDELAGFPNLGYEYDGVNKQFRLAKLVEEQWENVATMTVRSPCRIDGREASNEPLQFTVYISLTPTKGYKNWIDEDQPTVARLFYFVDSEHPEEYSQDLDNPHLVDHVLFRWFTERHLGGTHLKLTLAPPTSTSNPTLTMPTPMSAAQIGPEYPPLSSYSSSLTTVTKLLQTPLPPRIIFARQYTTSDKRSIRPGPFSTEPVLMKRTLREAIIQSNAAKSPLAYEELVMVQAQVITNFGLYLY
ncbi:hypothetical protein H4R33_006307 [Dimargaris cristalligena]|nr:hypothetical protein H4R33_006307 [Dimargaris cristalligena]